MNIRDRNGSNASTVTSTSTTSTTTSRDLSPMNTSNRLAAMGSRFFTNKKSTDSPAANPVAIELTSNTTNAAANQSDSPTVIVQKKTISTPSSPVPGLAWAKKLNNSLFSGSPNPGGFKLYGRSSGGTNDNTPKRLSKHELTPTNGDADVELKVLSATLNFDDEGSSDGENSAKDTDSGSESGDSGSAEDNDAESEEVTTSPVFPNLNNSSKKTKSGASTKTLEVVTTTEGVAMDTVDDLLSFSDSDKSSTEPSVQSDVAVVGTEDSSEGSAQTSTAVEGNDNVATGDDAAVTEDTPQEDKCVTPVPVTNGSNNGSETNSTKVKPVDVAGLQDRLVEAFLEEYRNKGRVIGTLY